MAVIETATARRYLIQLCKHFEHRCPAVYDDTMGEICFPAGQCRLQSDKRKLKIALETADGESLVQLQDVVARHLLRFAFRDEMHVAWHDASIGA